MHLPQLVDDALRKWRKTRLLHPRLIVLSALSILFMLLCYLSVPIHIERAIRGHGCIDPGSHAEHMYFDATQCVTQRERIAAIRETLRVFTRLLDARDIDYWLDSGTLLGQFREQDFIPWDEDADIGITQESFEKIKRFELAFDVPDGYVLHVKGSKFRPNDRDSAIPVRFIETKYGFYIDVFLFEDVNVHGVDLLAPQPADAWGGCKQCLTVGRDSPVSLLLIPRYYVFPLLPCRIADIQAYCPASRVLYLKHLYGNKFRKSSKGFFY